MYHYDFKFKCCKYRVSTNVQRDTYQWSNKVSEILSIEPDYPNFVSDQMHIHEKLDFELYTFGI